MGFDFYQRKFQIQDSSKLAVVGRDVRYSWSELESRVSELIGQLRRLEIPKGHPVVIRGQKEADFVTAILACMICELPYVPLDRVFPTGRVNQIQSILGSEVLIQCGEKEELSFGVELRAQVPSSFELKRHSIKHPLVGRIDADPLVYVIFTSGSTGEPKGVEITRHNTLDLLKWVQSSDFGFSRDDVFINQCSFSFDVSFFDLLASLQNGSTLILNAPEQIKNADEFTKRLVPLEPTVWVSTPSFLSLALLNRDFHSGVLPKLEKFYLAGETLHHGLVRRAFEKFPKAKVLNAYGPTEATVIVTLVDVTTELMQKYPTIPIGKVKAGTRMNLIETFEQDGNTVGELVIIGDNVARGYYGRPDLTERKFSVVDGQAAYRTGDHGYYQDGMVFFIGRMDNQVKLHGFRIEIDEIDSHIMGLDIVELSVTVPLIRDGDVKKLVTFVKLRETRSEPQLMMDVREWLETRIPGYMIPSVVKAVDEFPYGASHKVDKKKLIELL